jgi:hypothetical protein
LFTVDAKAFARAISSVNSGRTSGTSGTSGTWGPVDALFFANAVFSLAIFDVALAIIILVFFVLVARTVLVQIPTIDTSGPGFSLFSQAVVHIAFSVVVFVFFVLVAHAVFVQVPTVNSVDAIVAMTGTISLVQATLFEFTEFGVNVDVLDHNLLSTELVHAHRAACKLFALGAFLCRVFGQHGRDQQQEKKHSPFLHVWTRSFC